MSKTIYLRVGDRDKVGLGDFVTSLKGFLRLLKDFDSTVSGKESGTQRWEVTTVTMNSHIVVGVTPTPKAWMNDFSEAIEAELLNSSNTLTAKKERTPQMSDSALAGIKQLAKLSKRLGPSSIYMPANGQPKRESLITQVTMDAVEELTGTRYTAYGSVSGKLEAITVHGRSEFRVCDTSTGKVFRCKYKPEIEPKILRLLRKHVLVSGIIASNAGGFPISVEVEELAEKAQISVPANIREMAGFIKDYTGGRRLRDYLAEVADD